MRRFWTIAMGGVALSLALQTCIEPFRVELEPPVALLTVDGVLSDLPEPQFVRLRRSVPDGIEPGQGAAMEVIVDGRQTLSLPETRPGDYALPEGFRAEPGRTYQLRFQLSDGTRYESTIERMPAGKPIGRVYDEFDRKAVKRSNAGEAPGFLAGHRIFLDAQDPAGTRDFYNWKWKSWEAIDICITCVNSRYIGGTACWYPQPPAGPIQGEFDYDCAGRCWDIFGGKSLNLFSDSYSDGGPILGRPVAEVPFYTRNGALVEIEQQALTPGAFRYYKLLADQSQNTGSLVDTPPATIYGNVANPADANDKLVGFFTAASISRARYWLSRRNVPADAPPPLGFLGGRGVLRESGFGGIPPPPMPCLPSDTRTPVQPEGWQNR